MHPPAKIAVAKTIKTYVCDGTKRGAGKCRNYNSNRCKASHPATIKLSAANANVRKWGDFRRAALRSDTCRTDIRRVALVGSAGTGKSGG